MNKIEILDKLNYVLVKYDSTMCKINNESILEELEIEDLSKVQIIMEVERIFNIEFDLGDLSNISSVGDLVNFIENQQN